MVIAVIDIGTSAARLSVAQVHNIESKDDFSWKLLERAEKPLLIGKDIFTNQTISRGTMNELIEHLLMFKQLYEPYEPDQIIAMGTTTLKEAKNSEIIMDQINRVTDLNIKIITGIETNQLTYLAVEKNIKDSISDFYRYNSLIIEVGAGNTELMFLQQNKIAAAHSLPMGAMRYLYNTEGNHLNSEEKMNVYKIQTTRMINMLKMEFEMNKIRRLVAVGSDARNTAIILGLKAPRGTYVIPRKDFFSFMKILEKKTPGEISFEYNISFAEAELMLPALNILACFLEESNADEIIVPGSSIREGILLNYIHSPSQMKKKFHKQSLSSAKNLARHYRSLNAHAEQVRSNAVSLYKGLQKEFNLENRYLLEIAAILHDIGSFINGSSHHKHGLYIIMNADIFGLNNIEKKIVANIVRYHRRAHPQMNHTAFATLDKHSRMEVQKLSAILRIADALDRAHDQNLSIKNVIIENNICYISTDFVDDLSLVDMSLKDKSSLFDEVFGLQIKIKNTWES